MNIGEALIHHMRNVLAIIGTNTRARSRAMKDVGIRKRKFLLKSNI